MQELDALLAEMDQVDSVLGDHVHAFQMLADKNPKRWTEADWYYVKIAILFAASRAIYITAVRENNEETY